MFHLILSFGIILLLFSYHSWFKRRHLNQLKRKTVAQKFSLQQNILHVLLQLVLEWWRYIYPAQPSQRTRNIIVTLLLIVSLLYANLYWLQLPLAIFLPNVLLILFAGQLYIGRIYHQKYFTTHFTEALSIITSSISSGNSIHQALQYCGQQIRGDLGVAFDTIVKRLNLGEDPERVFNDIGKMYPYKEYYFFTIIMLLSFQRGGQLSVLINRLSRSITINQNMERRKAALTSEVRTSAKILSMIPILFFIGLRWLIPDNYDFIISDPSGRQILYYVLCSEILGIGLIWALVRRAAV